LQHQNGSLFQFQLSLFTRMLFSSLVDADFLATEEFMSPDRGSLRPTASPSFDQLAGQLSEFLNGLGAGRSDRVGQARADVLSACKSAATLHPGLFSLTVPTGGGKTLSSLAFALEHACQHGMSRIIYAIPFTSIIEQTAAVFRQVFDGFPEETVVEHHSNTDPELDKERVASRLATENWRAPLIVTTNVQLFESLFASRTSRCRKLHNICNSVIILDEVQTIPIDLLTPTLAVIRELVADYGCTIVLCTATQPTLNRSSEFPIGLEGVREIIPDPASLYAALRRVTVRHLGSQSDAAICNLLKEHSQYLCIVNTRPHAARLFQQTQDSLAAGVHGSLDHAPSADTSCFHLSTRMCAQHRMDILQVIRQRLTDGLPCQVISTQLIEAGVDVDFPVVYRSLSGIDSIAQAAGRCNREGKLTTGDVFVFEPTDVRLLGYLRSVADSAQELLVDLDANDMDLLSQETVSRYFQLHFMKHGDRWDQKRVMECFPSGSGKNHCRFNFRTASDRFRWIADTTETVFVPYGRGRRLIEKLRHVPTDRPDLLRPLIRRLQRFSVGLYDHVFRSMVGTDIEVLSSGYAVLMNDTCYDQQLGFNADVRGFHEPDSLIV
ncbi:MAG: CRISPR-associated helicase Cas3', partial [Planctomycetaceae bacterium]|nr:CRISPR-associated helicase Cas3' [Planctomycetaceae bacterium]